METKETGINIDEIKKQAIHDDLLTALCLLKKARDIMHETKDDIEIEEDQRKVLDSIQTDLNEHTANINDIIGSVMYSRIDNLI